MTCTVMSQNGLLTDMKSELMKKIKRFNIEESLQSTIQNLPKVVGGSWMNSDFKLRSASRQPSSEWKTRSSNT